MNREYARALSRGKGAAYELGGCIFDAGFLAADIFLDPTGAFIPDKFLIAMAAKKGLRHADEVASLATKIAEQGGKHSGQLTQLLKQTPEQLRKSIGSFENQISKHESWIRDPTSKVPDFCSLRPEHQQNLLYHWNQDVLRHQELRSIAQDVLRRF